jgi:hypothetical protein
MNFFRAYYTNSGNIVDVFKTVDFTSVLESDQYQLYTPVDSDNLMSIAYKFYQNIDDAWVLYFFNQMQDSTFAIIPNSMIDLSVNSYIDMIINYDSISSKNKLLIQELIREYYIVDYGYDISKAVIATNLVLSSYINRVSLGFIEPIKGLLYEQLMLKEKVSQPIKVPTLSIVFQMKSIMNKYSIAWKS